MLVLAGCGSETRTDIPARPASPYRYVAVPLAVQDRGRANGKYPIAVHDVSYAVPGGRVDAYVAVPSVKGNVPAVIYLHGSGEGRERFVLPATWAAARRAVGMTITLPSSTVAEASSLSPQEQLSRQRRIFVDDVVAVRRAIDYLRSRPDVDPSRIGLVGWSLGARVGAVTAGADHRLRAVVLMSGGASPISTYVVQAPARLRPQVRRVLTDIDPLHWLARAKAPILLQDGRRDEIVPRAALVALQKAAPKGTIVKWYPTGHELNAQAYIDQLAFLQKNLPIDGPKIPGAQTGP
jgi:dienelactone hydrolase